MTETCEPVMRGCIICLILGFLKILDINMDLWYWN